MKMKQSMENEKMKGAYMHAFEKDSNRAQT